MNIAQHILVFAVRVYRTAISPILTGLFSPVGLGCRFAPTCSQYALDAVRQHGAIKGSVLSVHRVCRCNPWGGCGHDPVPSAPFKFHFFNFKLSHSSRNCSAPGLHSAFGETASQPHK